MQLGATVVDAAHGGEVARGQGGHTVFDLLKKCGVLDERNLDRLGDPRSPFAVGQGFQEAQVVEHRPGRGERAGEVFLAEAVDTVLDADAGIVLGKRGGRNPQQANAPVRGGCRETTHVQQCPPTDHRQIGMAVQTRVADRTTDRLHVGRVVLDAFASRQQERGTGQRQGVGVPLEIPLDHGADGTAVFHVLIHHEKYAHGAARLAAPGQHDLAESEVRRGEKVGREMNVVTEINVHVARDRLHGNQSEKGTPEWVRGTQSAPHPPAESGISPMQPASTSQRTPDMPCLPPGAPAFSS